MNKNLILIFGTLLLMIILGQGYYIYWLSSRMHTDINNDLLSLNSSPVSDFQEDWFSNDIWDQFEKMHNIQDRINKMFGDSSIQFSAIPDFEDLFNSDKNLTTAIDIIEEDDKYIIKVNLQDVEEASVDVSVDDGRILTIKAETRNEEKIDQSGRSISKHNLMVGKFQQSMTLPPSIDTESMETEYKDGVLRIFFDRI